MRDIITYTTVHTCPHGNEVIETTSYDDKHDKWLGNEWDIKCDICKDKYCVKFNGKHWELKEKTQCYCDLCGCTWTDEDDTEYVKCEWCGAKHLRSDMHGTR